MLAKLIGAIPLPIIGRLMIAMAQAASRNKSWLDKSCRFLIGRVLEVPRNDDFMADEMIDHDEGFSLADIKAYRDGQKSSDFVVK